MEARRGGMPSGGPHYNPRMRKVRLDVLLVERGLAETRAQAQGLIMAGQVRVDGEAELKPGSPVVEAATLEVEPGPRFVSRGGEKLDAALTAFGLDVTGLVCADVGASTGGFTDCLLQRGAVKVYAIDVGKGILHWKLRQDARVVVMEKTNARYVEQLAEPVSLVTVDASFISLRVLLPVVRAWLVSEPDHNRGAVVLIKPQFEAGREDAKRGKGVIRDVQVHLHVLRDVLAFAASQGMGARGLLRSPLVGPKGNVEFLAWLMPGEGDREGLSALIESACAA